MKLTGNKLLILLAVLVIILIAVVIAGKKKGWFGGKQPMEVVYEEVSRRNIIETVGASGKIYPAIEVKISPEVYGEVIEIRVAEGDSVKKGDLLLKIKPDLYQAAVDRSAAALNQAKANLASARARQTQAIAQFENAKIVFERNKKLHKDGVISQAEFESAQVAYTGAEAEKEAASQNVLASEFTVKSGEATIKEASDNLSRTEIYAPIDGIVSVLHVQIGERVVGTTQMPGTELMRIADLENMEVHVDVSENDIIRVKLGDTVSVEVDPYLKRKFNGRVTQISNASAAGISLSAEQVTNFLVKIRLDKNSYQDLRNNPDNPFPFRPGMSASVEIQTSRANQVLSVPIQAVTFRDSKNRSVEEKEEEETEETENESSASSTNDEGYEAVFVEKDGSATLQKVKTGIQDKTHIEIISGVAEKDRVITGPYRAISRLLKDGDPVKATKKKDGD